MAACGRCCRSNPGRLNKIQNLRLKEAGGCWISFLVHLRELRGEGFVKGQMALRQASRCSSQRERLVKA